MSGSGWGDRLGLMMLALAAWARSHEWLRSIRALLPERLRSFISQRLAARMREQVGFSPLPAPKSGDKACATGTDVAVNEYPPSAGVNIFAYLRGQFGLGESARMYARALIDAGYPVSLNDIDLGLPHGFADGTLDALIGDEAPHGINLVFVNPDYLDAALEKIGREKLEGRYLIACWFWELERVPDSWLPALAHVDEILVASEFVESAVRQATDKPVLYVPLPLSEVGDSGLTRADFGLAKDTFLFLSSFDFNSWLDRKNPEAVMAAFQQAFPPAREDVQLLVKSSNGYRYPHKLLQLLEAAAGDKRIVVRDEVIDREHMQALQRCADAYVSLHRAEGFGLGLAECMLMGKPVVATGWSGNLDFMDSENSCLVDYRLVPVGEGEYPHAEGARWAEPDVADAARLLRVLADDPAFAGRIGEQAAADTRVTLSPGRAARLLIARFDEIASTRDGSPHHRGP